MFAKALSNVFTHAKRNHLMSHFAEKQIRNECIFLTTEILKKKGITMSDLFELCQQHKQTFYVVLHSRFCKIFIN